MAEYETSEEDLPLSSDAPALDDDASPPAAESAMTNSFVHSRLLDSVASLTHHRDIGALDHSLVLSLAELTSAARVVLAKRTIDGASVEAIVRCAPDAQGVYQLQEDDLDEVDPTLQLLYRCMHRLEAQTETVQGRHRLVVPILCDGRAIGALQLDSDLPPATSRPLTDGFARIYANYTALLHESEHDKLTGLYNRRSLERQLQRLLHERTLRMALPPANGSPGEPGGEPPQVWLAILDIDHFKRINDTYGHIYGDEVILLLAQQMRACFRRSDVLFRFGGEEFVILFGAAGEAVVHAVLERFRQRIAEHVFPQVGSVTVSIGYAGVGRHDYPSSALDRADKALYYAKQHGRNGVYGYESLSARGLLGQGMAPGSIDLF
ncbi:diguanylate cyclase [Rhodanobacter thiooxydans]|uniref:diguanylate cyclase n=1 Tax=Rhodanobacter thiooxydans TaxID=416169 RepID=A0A154QKN5_9GAMM|nr:GGDEF domain-containing protein [Rhodanobacter thiooxydans]EIL98585.1 diguanylate cyclase [Rhodanobacter thiooxydans LCS2]KZC24317.1 diguanylate cyclase [Rhodanobacter thiooxydans]MCW0201398.1 GGDEF domain-containing protein [Rhodanobacter thiooxydans]